MSRSSQDHKMKCQLGKISGGLITFVYPEVNFHQSKHMNNHKFLIRHGDISEKFTKRVWPEIGTSRNQPPLC